MGRHHATSSHRRYGRDGQARETACALADIIELKKRGLAGSVRRHVERERRFDRAGVPDPDPSLGSIPLLSFWSGKGDSNSRPSPWQGDALPLSYSRLSVTLVLTKWRPIGGSNPCYRRERAVSWTTRRMGRMERERRFDRAGVPDPDPSLGSIPLFTFWSGKGDSTGLAFQILTRALARYRFLRFGAGKEIRTPDPRLGKAMLYR